MSTREGTAQISVNIPDKLYSEYKKVLKSRIPRDNTTRDIIHHMLDVVNSDRAKKGMGPFSED